jgi:histidinol-phosphatase
LFIPATVDQVSRDLDFALELADLADELTLGRFRATDLRIETKPDLTPVSDVDRAVEQALRDRIKRDRPGDAVLGEEFGDERGFGTRWIIDPIDGTRNYVRGIPVFATLIALERKGELALGVASAPALHRRWWAARGEGSFVDGELAHVSLVHRLEDATFCYTSARSFDREGLLAPFMELAHGSWAARGFGDFWAHVLVAEGSADFAVETELAPWDVAAVKVIVEEAGGRCTGLDGQDTLSGGIVSSNTLLHDEVLASLRR